MVVAAQAKAQATATHFWQEEGPRAAIVAITSVADRVVMECYRRWSGGRVWREDRGRVFVRSEGRGVLPQREARGESIIIILKSTHARADNPPPLTTLCLVHVIPKWVLYFTLNVARYALFEERNPNV